MQICFIIQPFDGGQFDKRYKDIIEPAIKNLGLEPYRVDEDHSTIVPIENIERGIRDSVICLADISEDNPNVWYELGYAFSANKQVILICSKERDKFPFDIRHRTIIRYSKDSMRDFTELQEKIEKKIKALLEKQETYSKISSDSIAKVEGLSQHELITIVSIAENLDEPNGNVAAYSIKQDVENSGFTKMACVLGLQSLEKKKFILYTSYQDYNGNEYFAYQLTELGWNWINKNQDKFEMKKAQVTNQIVDFDENEIPF
jgi:hypothetical protein